MSLSVLYRDVQKASIGEIILDASIDESHTFENRVTAFPIEDGSVITDHIFAAPDRISISGIVTNYPIEEVRSDPVSQLQVMNNQITQPTLENRAQEAFRKLMAIRDNRQLVSIVTALVAYTNMALTNLSIPRNAKTFSSLNFTAEFVKVTFAQSKIIPISDIKEIYGARSQGAQPVEKGPQTTTEATEEQKTAPSQAYRLLFGNT